MKIEYIFCDKKGCKKIIGHKRYNGGFHWFIGTHQSGFKSTCCDKHLREVLRESKIK